jgi:hypothetical protein
MGIDPPSRLFRGDTMMSEVIQKNKSNYLVAYPAFAGEKGFNHPTVLVEAQDEAEAIVIAKYLHPHWNVGDVKEVNY